ncbi:MAG: SDR family oxidoreductase [Gammaproteobacteria bacterium]|nr:SDR family oxidoreductase [Gammaproteobacteria bacterium]
MISLNNKRIVITGASSGIGSATAELCAALGAKVLLLGKDEMRLTQTCTRLKGEGHVILATDLTSYDLMEENLTALLKTFGQVDGMVHSAGIEMTRPLKMLKPKNMQDVFEINVTAGLNLARILTKSNNWCNDGGSIVYISSIVGEVGQPGKIGYSASKGALIAATKSMALEFANKRIRVNCILPAMVRTPMSENLLQSLSNEARDNIEKMHPLGIGAVEDVSSACCFLLSDVSKWITGTAMVVDGGYSAQ